MKRVELNENILAFLRREPIANQNILNALENLDRLDRVIYVDDEDMPGVVFVHTGYMNYLYTQDCNQLIKLKPLFKKMNDHMGFSGVKRDIYEAVVKIYKEEWVSPCYLYYLPDEQDVIDSKKSYIDRLTEEDVSEVDLYYTYRNDMSYLKLRKSIIKRPSFCVRIDGELKSWLLVHEDGSMGAMYTKEDSRQKGYGKELTDQMIVKLRWLGKIPFVHILEDNVKSIGLAEKSGFVRHSQVVWFGIDMEEKKQGVQ